MQTELSHNLQQLSEKARSTTEFIQRLKGMSDKVTVSIYTCVTYTYIIYMFIFSFILIVCRNPAWSSSVWCTLSARLLYRRFTTVANICWRPYGMTRIPKSEYLRCVLDTLLFQFPPLTPSLSLQDQQSNCTGKLQQTTGLIQFCIEALKETDSAAFLQVRILQGICWVYSLLTPLSLSTRSAPC